MADKVTHTTRIDRLGSRANVEQGPLTLCRTIAAGTLNEGVPMAQCHRAPAFCLLFTGEPPRTGTSQVFARIRLDRYNSVASETSFPVPAVFPR
jgi:hypothetical protein